MRKLLFTLTILLAIVASTFAQDKIKVSVGYVGNEFKFDPNEVAEYLNGFWVDVDGRIVSKSGFRLGGVFNFQRTFDVTQVDRITYAIQTHPHVATVTALNVVQRVT